MLLICVFFSCTVVFLKTAVSKRTLCILIVEVNLMHKKKREETGAFDSLNLIMCCGLVTPEYDRRKIDG